MLLRRPISLRAYAEPCLGGGWEECKRGRSGGVRVERSPAPRSVPGFACHPLARSAAENSIITAGESGDWERKIRDPATLVAHARPRRSIPNTHTFFPGLGKSPKAAPSAGKRLSAPSAVAPPSSPPLRAYRGASRLHPCPVAAHYPRGCGLQQGAGERASERPSQPACERRLPPNSDREGGRGHRGLAPRRGAARRWQWPGECPASRSGGWRAAAPGGSLTPAEGSAG